MANLEELEARFREAQSAYMDDRSEENKQAYKEAAQAFSDARVAQRQEEEADPDHPRGRSMVVVNNDGEGEQ